MKNYWQKEEKRKTEKYETDLQGPQRDAELLQRDKKNLKETQNDIRKTHKRQQRETKQLQTNAERLQKEAKARGEAECLQSNTAELFVAASLSLCSLARDVSLQSGCVSVSQSTRALTACKHCDSLSLFPRRLSARLNAQELKESLCVCGAASRPRALTLAARSARLLIPLLGCHLPRRPSPPSDQVIRNFTEVPCSLCTFSSFPYLQASREMKVIH